jgi:hypothetical protein
MRERLPVVEAEVKHLRSEMQSEGIDMAGSVASCHYRLGSNKSSLQRPGFVPGHRVGTPSGVAPQLRPTHSTGRRAKRKFGRLWQRPRC